ncbi:MAG: hypothetical protein JSV92_00560 [archaeon]|nr:MAG: hypothetical protein JSV92_00560 [archaeon]
MNWKDKRLWIGIVVLLIIICIFIIIFLECPIRKYQLQNEVEEANYCEIDSDCENIEDNLCDFKPECIVVNKNEAERIKNMVELYGFECDSLYGHCGCEDMIVDGKVIVTSVTKCEKNRCVLEIITP